MVGDGQRPNSRSRLWLNCFASSLVASFAFSLRKSYSNGSCRKCRMPTTLTTVEHRERDGDRGGVPLEQAGQRAELQRRVRAATAPSPTLAPVEQQQHRRAATV